MTDPTHVVRRRSWMPRWRGCFEEIVTAPCGAPGGGFVGPGGTGLSPGGRADGGDASRPPRRPAPDAGPRQPAAGAAQRSLPGGAGELEEPLARLLDRLELLAEREAQP